MTVEDYLRDTEIEPPCGPDLEYDEQFMALTSAAAGKPEQQYGDTIIAAEDPDWRSLIEQATQLFARSKDIRTAVLLTRGLTSTNGLAGLAQGLEVTRRLLEQHWDEAHPRLSYDGVVDPLMRATALEGLADAAGLVRDIRLAPLFFTPAGPVTMRAAEATLKREPTTHDSISEAQLKQAAQSAAKSEDAPLLSVAAALEHCNAIASMATERLGNENAPDLAVLQNLLQTVHRLVPVPGGNGAAADGIADASPVVGAEGAPAASGELRSRQDALRMLDAVCRFLERSEPSNPAPLFIRRAQRLIGSDFLDIMRDMAPDSLGHIELLTGQQSSGASKDEPAQ
jgi:type VI secretion system protein ImpA